jgi:hypothetical protein
LKILIPPSINFFRYYLLQLEALVKLIEFRNVDKQLFIVPLYGISQDPDTKNFILVFKYINNNFHYYYRTRDFNPLILDTKLFCIWDICTKVTVRFPEF